MSDTLQVRFRAEVARRVAAEHDKSIALTELKAARYERDTAIKRLRDSEPGVAKVLAQVQEQGVVLERMRAALTKIADVPETCDWTSECRRLARGALRIG